MKLMLTVILACVLLGLLSPRLDQRHSLAITAFAIVMTLLYYLFPWRMV